jgi:hypothetical protein
VRNAQGKAKQRQTSKQAGKQAGMRALGKDDEQTIDLSH